MVENATNGPTASAGVANEFVRIANVEGGERGFIAIMELIGLFLNGTLGPESLGYLKKLLVPNHARETVARIADLERRIREAAAATNPPNTAAQMLLRWYESDENEIVLDHETT